MPLLQKKRRRPYLQRRAKRQRTTESETSFQSPPPSPLLPQAPPPSPQTELSTLCTSPTPPSSPASHLPSPTPLLTLPDDVFARIITILQNGPHLRGPVFQSARHAFPLALASRAALTRYCRFLQVIDAATSTQRDPSAPPLLREHLPPHIRSLVTLAGPNLRILRLPRYQESQIGAEAVLPVIDRCEALKELSFVDCGRVDRRLTDSIFANSLKVVFIERPSPHVVESLAASHAALRVVKLVDVTFSAMDYVVEMLKLRGSCLETLSLSFNGKSIQAVEDSTEKAGEVPAAVELRRFLDLVCNNLTNWIPRLQELEVLCSDQRDLEHVLVGAGDILQFGLGDVTNTVNNLREESDEEKRPTDLSIISLCIRTLKAIPWLFRTGEVRVRLPGYELRYKGRGEKFVKPSLWHFQMTTTLWRLEIPDLWRLTGGIDTLNIGDEDTVRSFDDMKEDFRVLIANARNLRRVIARLRMNEFAVAYKVMKYISFILQTAPWVREVEISHEVVLYHNRSEFSSMIQAMSLLQVVHLNAPVECWGGLGKVRLTDFVRNLPKVLRYLAEICKQLKLLYCERVGDATAPISEKTREELIRKLGETDVVIEGRLSKVDCTSLKALVVAWIEEIKQE